MATQGTWKHMWLMCLNARPLFIDSNGDTLPGISRMLLTHVSFWYFKSPHVLHILFHLIFQQSYVVGIIISISRWRNSPRLLVSGRESDTKACIPNLNIHTLSTPAVSGCPLPSCIPRLQAPLWVLLRRPSSPAKLHKGTSPSPSKVHCQSLPLRQSGICPTLQHLRHKRTVQECREFLSHPIQCPSVTSKQQFIPILQRASSEASSSVPEIPLSLCWNRGRNWKHCMLLPKELRFLSTFCRSPLVAWLLHTELD